MDMWIYDFSPYKEHHRATHVLAKSSPPATFLPKLVFLLSSMPNLENYRSGFLKVLPFHSNTLSMSLL